MKLQLSLNKTRKKVYNITSSIMLQLIYRTKESCTDMRSAVFTAVKMSVLVFCVLTSCGLAHDGDDDDGDEDDDDDDDGVRLRPLTAAINGTTVHPPGEIC
jgi:hypothetical protein